MHDVRMILFVFACHGLLAGHLDHLSPVALDPHAAASAALTYRKFKRLAVHAKCGMVELRHLLGTTLDIVTNQC